MFLKFFLDIIEIENTLELNRIHLDVIKSINIPFGVKIRKNSKQTKFRLNNLKILEFSEPTSSYNLHILICQPFPLITFNFQ